MSEFVFPQQDGWGNGLTGLTKRELFAAMAMQGAMLILATKEGCGVIAENAKRDGKTMRAWMAELSVEHADALIAELEKEKT